MTDYTNPPPPSGTRPLKDAEVTAAMRAWAIAVDHHPETYPIHTWTVQTFDGRDILAWVSWHTVQGSTGKVGHFWGVSLFEVVDPHALPPMVTQPPYVEGIDVSHYSGHVDWGNLVAQGIRFAYLKASEGTSYTDPSFEENVDAAREAGILIGAYHFFRPAQDVTAQVGRFLEATRTTPLDLPNVLDAEERDGVPVGVMADRAIEWLERVGGEVAIYTSPSFWPPIAPPAGTMLWDANWGVKSPALPATWKAWAFWQYAGNVTIVGAQGKVDRDRFNGTIESLRILCGLPGGADTERPTNPEGVDDGEGGA